MQSNSTRVSRINKQELIGKRFGRWVVLSFQGVNKHKKSLWLCRCSCGNERLVTKNSLRSGNSTSCGCYNKEQTSKSSTKHGLSRPGKMADEYRILHAIIMRCTNPLVHSYHRYGGRGITVCERWVGHDGIVNFVNDMGKRPSKLHSIDRIDNDGPYSPDNCRWATVKEQSENKRNNVHITIDGITRTTSQWAEMYKLSAHKVRWRLKKGWKVEDLFIHKDMRSRNGGKSTKSRRSDDKRLSKNKDKCTFVSA